MSNGRKRIPIKEGILSLPLDKLEEVRIIGSRCRVCGEVSLGTVTSCPNCVGEDLEQVPLSRKGKLWTYTVIRHRPPGDYKGAEPFEPFGEGLVEVPEGIRVLSPLVVDIDKLRIGMELELDVYKLYEKEGQEVIAFRFKPA